MRVPGCLWEFLGGLLGSMGVPQYPWRSLGVHEGPWVSLEVHEGLYEVSLGVRGGPRGSPNVSGGP